VTLNFDKMIKGSDYMNDTTVFNGEVILNENAKETLKEICFDLEERGYNAVKQIVGYLISGDPGYISSYKECRSKIQKLDRNSLIELMLKEYIK